MNDDTQHDQQHHVSTDATKRHGHEIHIVVDGEREHTHESTLTPRQIIQLFTERNICPVAAAYQGGLLLSQGEQRHVHFQHFRKRLELCQALGIPTMLLVADFAQRPDATALERSVVSLTQAAQWAAGFDVPHHCD